MTELDFEVVNVAARCWPPVETMFLLDNPKELIEMRLMVCACDTDAQNRQQIPFNTYNICLALLINSVSINKLRNFNQNCFLAKSLFRS